MPHRWRERAFTQDEAAKLSGLHPVTLRSIVHRARDIDVLFSEKRKTRRFFSPRDITVLRIGYELERAGRTWLTAIAMAFEHTEHPPPDDALLLVRGKSVSAFSGVIIDEDELARLAIEESIIVIPVGKLVAEVRAACHDIGGA